MPAGGVVGDVAHVDRVADLHDDALAPAAEAGLALRPVNFVPTWDKHRGTGCGGAFLHVTNPQAFASVRTGLAVVAEARKRGGREFR